VEFNLGMRFNLQTVGEKLEPRIFRSFTKRFAKGHYFYNQADVLLPQGELGLRLRRRSGCPLVLLHQEHQQPDHHLQQIRVR
jgi:hypothetical protein